jgi:hypothetical protein
VGACNQILFPIFWEERILLYAESLWVGKRKRPFSVWDFLNGEIFGLFGSVFSAWETEKSTQLIF